MSLNSQDWIRLHAEAQNVIWVSQLDGEDLNSLGVTCCLLERASAGSWIESGGAGTQAMHSDKGYRQTKLQFNPYAYPEFPLFLRMNSIVKSILIAFSFIK